MLTAKKYTSEVGIDMANPLLLALLIGSAHKAGSKLFEDPNKDAAQMQGNITNSVINARSNRRAVQSAMQSQVENTGRTGLAGIDAMSPATTRQQQVFASIMNKYRPQSGVME